MKDTMEPTPTRPSDEQDNFANRKLIRPALPRVDNHGNHNSNHNSNHSSGHMQGGERRERHDRGERGGFERAERPIGAGGGGRKSAPPEQTNAENFYYQKQMQTRTPMVIVLQDGEEVHGIIEWYDKTCIKIVREDGEPNLMIYKPAIKYMFKEEERRR
ncbi:MAG: RNA chaperone Hfq [Candidatus Sulfotelmatobacter sp.]|jgi:host factor-I protein